MYGRAVLSSDRGSTLEQHHPDVAEGHVRNGDADDAHDGWAAQHGEWPVNHANGRRGLELLPFELPLRVSASRSMRRRLRPHLDDGGRLGVVLDAHDLATR